MEKITSELITKVLNDGLITNERAVEQKVGFFDIDNQIYLIMKVDLPNYIVDTINEYNNSKLDLKIQKEQIEQLQRQKNTLQDDINKLKKELSEKIEISNLDNVIVELEKMRKEIESGEPK